MVLVQCIYCAVSYTHVDWEAKNKSFKKLVKFKWSFQKIEKPLLTFNVLTKYYLMTIKSLKCRIKNKLSLQLEALQTVTISP